ncbi:hypothetical protein JOD57_001662 [Geodermatophilus bullaregiensis]|uniref:hypothetical protein n=1 Tax=Geodermatophilus bullaregiensis TaxID=1564160 RepID=UPI00195A5A2B|nr:hypothetical protein [Geodermatophilus bullaregiensis]MBM7805825.1 hypothetical protein [Geodermatophilus bullaregiensis]
MTADRDADGARSSDEMRTLPGAAPWLPDAEGTYEESRLAALLTDLHHQAISEPLPLMDGHEPEGGGPPTTGASDS